MGENIDVNAALLIQFAAPLDPDDKNSKVLIMPLVGYLNAVDINNTRAIVEYMTDQYIAAKMKWDVEKKKYMSEKGKR